MTDKPAAGSRATRDDSSKTHVDRVLPESLSISFALVPGEPSHGHRLVYRCKEFSFDMEPLMGGRDAGVTLNEVGLDLDRRNRVVCVSGYCPHLSWKETPAIVPPHVAAGLALVTPTEVRSGASLELAYPDGRWPAYVNADHWVCLGDPTVQSDEAVEFTPGCVAVLEGGRLLSLWLHPAIVP